MKYLRWYDKDQYLSAFMKLLEGLPEDVQSQVAVDILLYIPKIIKKDFAKFINIVSGYDPREYNRWYDQNPNVHTAVEAIRELDPDKRDELINEISDIIVRYTEGTAGSSSDDDSFDDIENIDIFTDLDE